MQSIFPLCAALLLAFPNLLTALPHLSALSPPSYTFNSQVYWSSIPTITGSNPGAPSSSATKDENKESSGYHIAAANLVAPLHSNNRRTYKRADEQNDGSSTANTNAGTFDSTNASTHTEQNEAIPTTNTSSTTLTSPSPSIHIPVTYWKPPVIKHSGGALVPRPRALPFPESGRRGRRADLNLPAEKAIYSSTPSPTPSSHPRDPSNNPRRSRSDSSNKIATSPFESPGLLRSFNFNPRRQALPLPGAPSARDQEAALVPVPPPPTAPFVRYRKREGSSEETNIPPPAPFASAPSPSSSSSPSPADETPTYLSFNNNNNNNKVSEPALIPPRAQRLVRTPASPNHFNGKREGSSEENDVTPSSSSLKVPAATFTSSSASKSLYPLQATVAPEPLAGGQYLSFNDNNKVAESALVPP